MSLRRLITATDMKRIEWLVTRREKGAEQGEKGIPRSCLLIFRICEVSAFERGAMNIFRTFCANIADLPQSILSILSGTGVLNGC